MRSEQRDLPAETLEEVRAGMAPSLGRELVDAIYRVELRTQFDEERSEAIRYIGKLINDYVAENVELQSRAGKQ